MDSAPIPIPLPAHDAALARQPALLLFGFFLATQVTLAAILQVMSIPFGLGYSELLLFALPTVLLARAGNWRVIPFLRLRNPGAGLIGLGFLAGAVNFLTAGALQAAARSTVPADLARRFDATHLFEDLSGLELGALVVVLAVVAPLCEEIAFRGYVQRVLGARYRSATAVVITAILFALLHLDPIGMAARIELGVLFGLLALWTGSLWPAIAAHAANNLISSVIVVYLKLHPAEATQSGSLAKTLALGVAGLVGVVLVMLQVRRGAASTPPLESCDGTDDHSVALGRIRTWVPAWLGAAAVCATLVVVLGWPNGRVTFADAAVPLHELEKALPDDAARKVLKARLKVERQRVRSGALDVEAYRSLRKHLAELGHAGVTLADVQTAMDEADAPKR